MIEESLFEGSHLLRLEEKNGVQIALFKLLKLENNKEGLMRFLDINASTISYIIENDKKISELARQGQYQEAAKLLKQKLEETEDRFEKELSSFQTDFDNRSKTWLELIDKISMKAKKKDDIKQALMRLKFFAGCGENDSEENKLTPLQRLRGKSKVFNRPYICFIFDEVISELSQLMHSKHSWSREIRESEGAELFEQITGDIKKFKEESEKKYPNLFIVPLLV